LEAILDCFIYGIDPNPWILLHVPIRQARNQLVILLRASLYSTGFEINDDGLCALCAAIDTNVEHTDWKPAINRVRASNPKIRRALNIRNPLHADTSVPPRHPNFLKGLYGPGDPVVAMSAYG
jgi:hypothetical protein